MSPTQWEWLEAVEGRIPGLHGIQTSSDEAVYIMGKRVINGRTVRLSLVAQVVNPGGNPLRSHASVNSPNTSDVVRPEGMIEPEARRRNAKRPNPW